LGHQVGVLVGHLDHLLAVQPLLLVRCAALHTPIEIQTHPIPLLCHQYVLGREGLVEGLGLDLLLLDIVLLLGLAVPFLLNLL